jgi:hypothetical protein
MASVVVRSYYHYEPSLVAAVIFAALYGLAFIATVVQWVRYRAWVWLAMVVASGSMSTSCFCVAEALDCI